MPLTPAEWLAAYRDARLRRDADTAAGLFTADATYAEQPYQESFVGPAAVRDYWARVTATQATLDNDGVPVTLAGAFILMFDDSGLCRSLREYWQFTDGTREPKRGWGT